MVCPYYTCVIGRANPAPRRPTPRRLLCADKPGDTKVYSFGKLKFSSSLSTLLFRVDVASGTPIPFRPQGRE